MKNTFSKKLISFVKKETVLVVAWVLALISLFIIHPDKGYLEYIDWRSLGILWGLMVVMQGLKCNGFFEKIGHFLLMRTKRVWQLSAVLVGLCFFSSMFITNDVALITFVPFAVLMLKSCKREDILIPIIAFQTIAANLGSMLTPIGNPQNLYLFGLSGVDVLTFVGWLLPYTAIAFVGIIIALFTIKGKNESVGEPERPEIKDSASYTDFIYGILFVLALVVVAKVVPYYVLVVATFVVVAIMDRKVLLQVDYSLLFTFIGFFIFTGNMGRIPALQTMLLQMLNGREIIIATGVSQVISNVPCALLLSGFTENIKALTIGVDIGGLGTLIASMASLISYKAIARDYGHLRVKYIAYFSVVNVLFLIVLIGASFVI